MLTGDENIVDVDFSVLWKVKPSRVGDYLFNVQNPESTVKAVGESAMRAVIGHSNIQAILTGARQTIETAVQELMQKTLDDYGAGVVVQQVQLQKVDPPTRCWTPSATCKPRAPISSGRRTRRRLMPIACAGGARPRRKHPGREAYREQTVADAKGQTSRFSQSTTNTKSARRDRQRMYLEPWSGFSAYR